MAEKNDYEDRLGRLRQALDSGAMNAVQRSLHALSPAEIGRLLESLPPSPREVLWGVIDPEDRGEVLLHFGAVEQASMRDGLARCQLLQAQLNLELNRFRWLRLMSWRGLGVDQVVARVDPEQRVGLEEPQLVV